jgi:hypothetical protein
VNVDDLQIGGRYRMHVERGHWETYEGKVIGFSSAWWVDAPDQGDIRFAVLDTGDGMERLVSIPLNEIDNVQPIV